MGAYDTRLPATPIHRCVEHRDDNDRLQYTDSWDVYVGYPKSDKTNTHRWIHIDIHDRGGYDSVVIHGSLEQFEALGMKLVTEVARVRKEMIADTANWKLATDEAPNNG